MTEMETRMYKRRKYMIYVSLFIGYSVYFYNRKSYTSVIAVLHEVVGIEESELGAISSSLALSYGLSKFVSGVLSDAVQPRKLFVCGLVATGLCTALFTVSDTVWVLVVVWFMNGLAQGVSWPPASKLLKVWFTPTEIGTYWSLLTVGSNLMSGMCPLISTYLAAKYSWQVAMLVPSAVALVVAPLIYIMLYNSPEEAGITQDTTSVKSTEVATNIVKTRWSKVVFLLLRSPFLWVLIHGYFVTNLLKAAFSDWIQLYLIHDKKHSLSSASVAVSCFEIGGMAGSIIAGVFTDKWMKQHNNLSNRSPRMPMFCWLFAIFVVCIHMLRSVVVATSTMFFVGTVLFGCGMAVSGSISMYGLIAMENGPPGYSGTSHAIVALASNAGAVLAGFPLASFGKAHGWNQTFFLLQCLGVINLIIHLLTCNLDRRMVDMSKLE